MPSRALASLRRHPSGVLLAVQLLGLLLYPLMEGTGPGRAVFGAFGVLVLALALWVVVRSPTTNWIAALLAVPAVALTLLGSWAGDVRWLVWGQALESALYFYAAAGLIGYMLGDLRVTADELLAAGATFTLLAWAFAFAYSVCQAVAPGSFNAAVDPGSARTWMELLFLSFTTLSGVGLGDIVPITPWARALVMLEQFSGVMYIAVVVSRLIGLTIVRAERS
jgi:Ion channel